MTEKNTMQTVHIIVSGKVQGVGFRAYTLKFAQQFNLSGWVKNLPTSEVEITVSGSSENIQQFITIIQNSPSPFSIVTDTKVDYIPYKDFLNFKIQY